MASEERNALADLANELAWYDDRSPIPDRIPTMQLHEAINKAHRIIAELAKEFEPIDVNSVEPGEDGIRHLVDYIKARDNRRCEIMIRCREIAEEGAKE